MRFLSARAGKAASELRPPKPALRHFRRAWKAGAALAAALGLLAAMMVAEVWQLNAVTEAKRRIPTRYGNQALVVIDIQEEYTGVSAESPFPYPGSAALIQRVNALSALAAHSGIEVVYVRQIYSRPLSKWVSRLWLGGRGLQESFEANFDRRLQLVSSDVFEKPLADAFSNRDFEELLFARRVSQVILVGLDGAGCVDRTARGARRRGLRVAIVEDAILSLNPAEWAQKKRDYPELGIQLVTTESMFPPRPRPER